MKRLLAGLIALALMLTPVLAQQNTNVGMYEASPATIIEGQRAPVLLDTLRRLVVVTSSSSPLLVGGGVADGVTDSGNTVKVGGIVSPASLPGYSGGTRTAFYATAGGVQLVSITGNVVTDADAQSNTNVIAPGSSGASSNAGTTRTGLLVVPKFFNGTSWDRAFTCPSTAVVNVTAAATTQIVALASSQIIRVCSFSVAMSAAGTAKFVYGTGTNCGTGTTDLTGAMPLATGTPWTMSSGNGSVLRTIASNALCVAAVTGNVVGVVNYAQY